MPLNLPRVQSKFDNRENQRTPKTTSSTRVNPKLHALQATTMLPLADASAADDDAPLEISVPMETGSPVTGLAAGAMLPLGCIGPDGTNELVSSNEIRRLSAVVETSPVAIEDELSLIHI